MDIIALLLDLIQPNQIMNKKLVVLPNDSLLDYYNKGEIKSRYFNPQNWFDEIHVISLFDKEIEPEKVQKLAGNAILKIHNFGKVNLSNYGLVEKKIIEKISEINPQMIRAFNPRVQGWLATKASQKLEIPVVISLHTNYEEQTEYAKKQGNYFKFLKLKYSSRKLEKFCLQNSNAVICVYQYIVPYAQKMGASNIQVIYNKVDSEKFSTSIEKKIVFDKPTVISVGRLIEQKNRKYIIEAVKGLDIELLIIGDGPQLNELNQLINSLELSQKVKIVKSVPNEELAQYYLAADIFALAIEDFGQGIPIPVIEAMSCGLPVVITKHSDSYSEIIDQAVVSVENKPTEFHQAFKEILAKPDFKKQLVTKSLKVANLINGNTMEEKELQLYKNLMR